MNPDKLLTREQFRDQVFLRDGGKCVFCEKPAVDAHHILERRLWPDGGYYLNNGASVCEAHHLDCEKTIITVEDVRSAAKITKPVIPPHLYGDQSYDKWGNPILSNGLRLKGELFFDESIQKILKAANVLDLFCEYVKYPRTYHLPWSESVNSDDRMIQSLDGFIGKRVIVTEKMDGENTSMYRDYIHARSVDGRNHPSRNWVKQFWSKISGDIPAGWRVCGENLYAEHSIKYDNLQSYFMGFSIWNEKNICLSWDETQEWFNLLGVCSVTTLYDGVFDESLIKELWDSKNSERSEGYVVRVADEIAYAAFNKFVAKFVRKDHVQTVKHWMYGQPVKPNGILK